MLILTSWSLLCVCACVPLFSRRAAGWIDRLVVMGEPKIK